MSMAKSELLFKEEEEKKKNSTHAAYMEKQIALNAMFAHMYMATECLIYFMISTMAV